MYGRNIEIHVKGGGRLNTIPFSPNQERDEVRTKGDNVTYSREGAIKHAKRLIARWYATDQFSSAKLTWRVA